MEKPELQNYVLYLERKLFELKTSEMLQDEIKSLKSQIQVMEEEITRRDHRDHLAALEGPRSLANMQGLIDEVDPVTSLPPSQELQLRRNLAELAIWDAADIEAAGMEPPPDATWVTAASTQTWRARQSERLAYSRMPNWETDDPPPLTGAETAVLAKHVATEVQGAASRALDELRSGRSRSLWYAGGR